jgi:hypothetical protein
MRLTTGAKLSLISPADDGTRTSWAGAAEPNAEITARHASDRNITVMTRIPRGVIARDIDRAPRDLKGGRA